ncbi:ArsR family transcriptional regulator [Deinococcus planocerae]|uniref:ArsR family transcriptional regulator n=1 Tax=Deinococcus planocerae TaxID=1737569 RepID=UPI001CA4CBC3|nr:ArsR family transcriptional regulator [Deinococcus planocerae]
MSVLTPPAPGLLEAKAKLFRGLSDRSRLSLLEAPREEPRRMSERVALTGLTQPNVSTPWPACGTAAWCRPSGWGASTVTG